MDYTIVMETIITKERLAISALLVSEYSRGKLFFAQERLILTNLINEEVRSMDIISFVDDHM